MTGAALFDTLRLHPVVDALRRHPDLAQRINSIFLRGAVEGWGASRYAGALLELVVEASRQQGSDPAAVLRSLADDAERAAILFRIEVEGTLSALSAASVQHDQGEAPELTRDRARALALRAMDPAPGRIPDRIVDQVQNTILAAAAGVYGRPREPDIFAEQALPSRSDTTNGGSQFPLVDTPASKDTR